METITGAGVGVISLEEYQPTFDEVFTELVRERRAQREGNAEAAAHAA
jgi:hypothetical protein